ncbi:glycerol-3-phosphate dehydrogenase/oxidase [Hydrocarboniclastica marina]|uniref:Glycerol-3-phosphate dehydrogenase/oxidase n=1 Tax=Hydrocarboniclastica marina TaxID=2259620 RepID=A0A4P7XIG3_9ALTE|nr:glycerol-3-phosphate dehydrogenase/oxidase [Hydrocarboniclastica marina]QCF26808.1 glycerol-3-phosphate dehydrogenase/oxidase [Hydrocarboniclastica marina]
MQLRAAKIAALKATEFDVLVVGAGINGAVSAAALSAKGVKVGLIDKRDFAGFTSQQSSNLAWGGIKYLESFEFGLVRKLCKSRNALIRSYPSTVKEIRFLASLGQGFRYPGWVMYLVTLLYWVMGDCFTRSPRLLGRSRIAREEPIIDVERCIGGFEYSDAYLYDNDARFVFNFVRSALTSGAAAANYVESLGATKIQGLWHVRARDVLSGDSFSIKTKVLINACGPFVDHHNSLVGQVSKHRHVFSKGIHLIVDRLTPSNRVLAFFADDGRLFFVIPMGTKTCIGTTDTRTDSPFASVTAADRRFVLDNINARLKLKQPLTTKDIISERCGVRPLVVEGAGSDDWLSLSRRHLVEADLSRRYLSIYGGKLTDCLNVGNEVVDRVEACGVKVPLKVEKWFGEPPAEVRAAFFAEASQMGLDGMTPASSSEKLSIRFWRRYGRDAFELLAKIRKEPAQALPVMAGAEYLRCELEQAARYEMVSKLEDFLRRRSKIELVLRRAELRASGGLKEICSLLFGDMAEQKLEEYFEQNTADDGGFPGDASATKG